MGWARVVGVPLGVVLGCALLACSDPPGREDTNGGRDTGSGRSDAASPATPASPAESKLPSPDRSHPTPMPSARKPTAQGPITVTVVGDVMLGREVAEAHGPAVEQVWQPTKQRLRRADLAVATFEATLSRLGPPTQGSDSFAASPRVLRPLRAAGLDAVSLANNHVGDFGQRSLVDTVRRLRGAGIAPFGAGADGARAWRPKVFERSGIRVALVGFNAIGETPRADAAQPGAAELRMPPRTGPLATSDLARARRAIEEARQRADAVIAMPHWGAQYTHRPVAAQHRVARALVGAGADAVIGGHPHWVQQADSHQGVPIVHSLGNFVFDMDWESQVREGVAAELTVTTEGVTAARLVPYRIDASYTPRWVRGDAARQILAAMGAPADGVLPVP